MPTEFVPPPVPRAIELPSAGRQVVIDWRDGGRTAIAAFDLRRLCPCAICVNELSGERILRSADIDPAVSARSFSPIGRYGLQFNWSDGHDTGIYTHRMLRVIEQGSPG